MTTSIEKRDQAEFIELTFEKGIPVALDGKNFLISVDQWRECHCWETRYRTYRPC